MSEEKKYSTAQVRVYLELYSDVVRRFNDLNKNSYMHPSSKDSLRVLLKRVKSELPEELKDDRFCDCVKRLENRLHESL
jgi:hypothetical protein